MNDVVNKLYSVNLDPILNKKHISRYKVSKDTGITKKTLRELGKRDFRISTAIQLCIYLEIELNELITIK
jgi:DNA-binding Xre family transcriptional regulator